MLKQEKIIKLIDIVCFYFSAPCIKHKALTRPIKKLKCYMGGGGGYDKKENIAKITQIATICI
jgi:hypothetical protein